MTSLAFFCPCVPPTATHHHKKIIRAGKFLRLGDKPELQAARVFLESVLQPHQPPAPIAGAVALAVEFTWPWLASTTKRTRATYTRIRKRSKPDCSNLAKTLEDRLAALCFIEADENVVELHVRKYFGDVPGIRVEISAVDDAAEARLAAPTQHGLLP